MFLLSTLGSVAKSWSDVHFQETPRLLCREKILGARREAKREREENCPLGADPELGQQIKGSDRTYPRCYGASAAAEAPGSLGDQRKCWFEAEVERDFTWGPFKGNLGTWQPCSLGAGKQSSAQRWWMVLHGSQHSPGCSSVAPSLQPRCYLCALAVLPPRNLTIVKHAPVHSSYVYIFILLNSTYLWVSVKMRQLEFAKHSKGFFKAWKNVTT